MKSMSDFTSPEVLYKELITSVRKYHPSADISMIEKAYAVASEADKDQKRKSGEPYIIHPLCVAIILADLELDKETIVAGDVYKRQACDNYIFYVSWRRSAWWNALLREICTKKSFKL